MAIRGERARQRKSSREFAKQIEEQYSHLWSWRAAPVYEAQHFKRLAVPAGRHFADEELKAGWLDLLSKTRAPHTRTIFGSLTIRNRRRSLRSDLRPFRPRVNLRGPHPERLAKAVQSFSLFLQMQTYGPFPLATKTICYKFGTERGSCPCGEKRWHSHVIFEVPDWVSDEELSRWSIRWLSDNGFCNLQFARNEDAVRNYAVISYALKGGEVDVRTAYEDWLDREEKKKNESESGEESPRACPCPRCGLVSLCECYCKICRQLKRSCSCANSLQEPSTPSQPEAEGSCDEGIRASENQGECQSVFVFSGTKPDLGLIPPDPLNHRLSRRERRRSRYQKYCSRQSHAVECSSAADPSAQK
jgi:hypothetical protein